MLDDRIAVIPIEDPEKIGHIIIPDTAKRRVDQGIIKYRGDNVKELKVGDHVCFSGYTGTKISVKGEGTLIIMKEEDVVALIGEGQELFTKGQVERFFSNALDETLRRGHVDDCPGSIFKSLFLAQFESQVERAMEF
jgi:co-chaperonin GroES (HSP10)